MAGESVTFNWEPNARQVFDTFLVGEPLVAVEGLFRVKDDFFIVAQGIDQPASDGEGTIERWFDYSVRPVTSPIRLVTKRPDGAALIRARSAAELRDAHGYQPTLADVERQLSLFLPRDFPLADVAERNQALVVLTKRELDASEREMLDQALIRLGSPTTYVVEVDPTASMSGSTDPLRLPLARSLSSVPAVLRNFVEADESFWSDNFQQALSGELGVQTIFPEVKGRACLVGTTFPISNIRNYLSLYDRVVLGMPLEKETDARISELGISRKQLVELARLGRVQFLAPQGIHRYSPNFLTDLLEGAPASVIGSRRLAAATHAQTIARNPLFVLPGTAEERRMALRGLLQLGAEDPRAVRFTRSVARGLSAAWTHHEFTLHLRGAMSSLNGPLASVARAVLLEMTGRDFFIELGSVAQYIEWASALGADYAPFEHDDYSEVGHGEFLLGMHTGIARAGASTQIAGPSHFEVANELLVLDNDVEIFDFVRELGDGDLSRFRDLVTNLARPDRSAEERAEIIAMWNSQMRAYERRPERMKSMGIAGIALGLGGRVLGVPDVVSFSALFLPAILTQLHEDAGQSSRLVGTILDTLNALLANVQTDAVLLARMRKRVKGMKS